MISLSRTISRLSIGAFSVVAIFFAMAPVTVAQDRCDGIAQFDRARKYSDNDDPRAENEYRSAIVRNKSRCPDIQLEFSLYLANKLRFDEAALELAAFIKRTPGEDHADERVYLANFRQASVLTSSIESNANPKLQDLLELARIIPFYADSRHAVPYVEKAIELYPGSTEAILRLADLLYIDKQSSPEVNKRTLELLDRAISLEPGNASARAKRGWLYYWRLRVLSQAEVDFRKALELSNGSNCSATLGLGYALFSRSERQEAASQLRKYLNVCSADASQSGTDYSVKQILAQIESEVSMQR